MSTTLTTDEVQHRLGGVPQARILTTPPPGTATVDDLLERQAETDVTLELVEGTLVEKAMGTRESLIAGQLFRLLDEFAESHGLGLVLPGDGQLGIQIDRVRAPDVSFVSKDQFPDRTLPEDAIWRVCPDLAVEVVSRGNTPAEMDRKRQEYFDAGTRLVWIVEPRKRSATIHRPDAEPRTIDEQGTLDGGDVLPGFTLKLADLFARAERFGSGGSGH